LVQLQADLKKIEAAGVQLVGISYDPVQVLPGFTQKRHIQFPLLSDPGSQTIRAYGILNEKAKGRTEGIPYPGTFLIDQQGVIRAKLFHEGYRQRHSTDELIESAKAVK
jgi:peroxiredoxin